MDTALILLNTETRN